MTNINIEWYFVRFRLLFRREAITALKENWNSKAESYFPYSPLRCVTCLPIQSRGNMHKPEAAELWACRHVSTARTYTLDTKGNNRPMCHSSPWTTSMPPIWLGYEKVERERTSYSVHMDNRSQKTPVPARKTTPSFSFERLFLLLIHFALPPQAVASQDPHRACESPLPNAAPALECFAAQLFKMGSRTSRGITGGRDGIKKM